jgi:hypothetical protein
MMIYAVVRPAGQLAPLSSLRRTSQISLKCCQQVIQRWWWLLGW